MSNDKDKNKNESQEILKERYKVCLDTRKFEIELFWKRSLFFWGFIASSFVGYAAVYQESKALSLIIANFGFVCSFAWTMANRGSKYWQENWESKVDEIEDKITGELFKIPAKIQVHKGFWLRARRYSVSKLTIALSDYVFLLWTTLVISGIIRLLVNTIPNCIKIALACVFTTVSFVYVLLMGIIAKTTSKRGN